MVLGLVVALAVAVTVEAKPTTAKAEPRLMCAEKAEMGTPFKVCVYAEESRRKETQGDLAKAFAELQEINAWMSDWIPGTELNQVNDSAGMKPVSVRKELFDILKYVREVSDATEGAFDPSFNAFWGLYNFKEGQNREPTEKEIAERLPLVNYKNIELDEKKQTVFLKKPKMKIGLGGIGQGYGVDQIVKNLKKKYSAGYVDGSGDTYFWGKKPNGMMWVTGVRDPLNKIKDVGRIYGTDFAITTSGDDEKFFMVGDRRVHHILDPKTGKPVKGTRQVTVIARTATEADAYDTASFVMGRAKGEKVLEQKNLAAVFIDDSGVHFTKGLRKTKTDWGEVYLFEPQK